MEWKEESGYILCPMLPVVGALLGMLWALLLFLLPRWDVLPMLRGAVMTLVTLALTGGLHMDGLMDTCDAVFSRRDRETRLRILSDTHAGSFAVMGCVAVLILKTALFAEILRRPAGLPVFCATALIPLWSRLGMAVMLNSKPFAHEGGLARMFGASRDKGHNLYFIIAALCLGACAAGLGAWLLPAIWFAAFLLWQRLCMTMFGGITGDLLGAFSELSETAMLFALV